MEREEMEITYAQKQYLLAFVEEKLNRIRVALSYLSVCDDEVDTALNENRRALEAMQNDIANTKCDDEPVI